jgi:septal ring factor EnvC (AmiA/AmiB activator)
MFCRTKNYFNRCWALAKLWRNKVNETMLWVGLCVYIATLFGLLYGLLVKVLNEKNKLLEHKIESMSELSSRINAIEKFHEYEIKSLQIDLGNAVKQKEEEKQKIIKEKIEEIKNKDEELIGLRKESDTLKEKISKIENSSLIMALAARISKGDKLWGEDTLLTQAAKKYGKQEPE